MLIICNGTFKSGSTWLHAIILEVLKVNEIILKDVPFYYTNNINSPTTIIESKFFDFLLYEDYLQNNYITKSHYHLLKTINRDYDSNIYFFFVERDVRDAVVSHYYHLKKKYKFIGGFRTYYLFLGKFKAFEILKFNRRYLESFGEDTFFKYSDMKNDFESVLVKISSILNLKDLSKEDMNTIKKNTSISKMRSDLSSGNSKYYSTVSEGREGMIRKGVIGEWLTHFSARQEKDISRLENSIFIRISYYFLFTLTLYQTCICCAANCFDQFASTFANVFSKMSSTKCLNSKTQPDNATETKLSFNERERILLQGIEQGMFNKKFGTEDESKTAEMPNEEKIRRALLLNKNTTKDQIIRELGMGQAASLVWLAHYIIHETTLHIYGGFIRDFIYRGEVFKNMDLDVGIPKDGSLSPDDAKNIVESWATEAGVPLLATEGWKRVLEATFQCLDGSTEMNVEILSCRVSRKTFYFIIGKIPTSSSRCVL